MSDRLTESPAWRALKTHHQSMASMRIASLFADDPKRFENFSLQSGELLLDYSKNLVTTETIKLLANLPRECGVGDLMQRMFRGDKINTSENRPVLHTALRDERTVIVDDIDVLPQVLAARE